MGRGLNLGESFPDVEVTTTEGKFRLYDYFGDGCVPAAARAPHGAAIAAARRD